MAVSKDCISNFKDTKLVLEEKKSKIIFENPTRSELKVVKVDGCAIEEGIRCDYLVLDKSLTEHFLELKGSDIEHAVKQLERSIALLSSNPKQLPKHAYVVSVRCPLSGTDIQKIKKQFREKYSSSFIVRNSPHTVSVNI